MKYQSYHKLVFVSLVFGCMFLVEAVFFHSTSLAYTLSTLAVPTPRPTIISTATPEARPMPTVIVISQPSSFLDPSSIIAIIAIVVQAVTLILVYRYVRDTATMATATRDSANATQASEEA